MSEVLETCFTFQKIHLLKIIDLGIFVRKADDRFIYP